MAFYVTARRALLLGTAGLGAAAAYRYNGVKRRENLLPNEPLWQFPEHNDKQQVIVIGGGVVGVTAAYKLALRGHSVAVLEPRPAPSLECSACAAGGMQRSNPVVDKDSWMAVLKSILPGGGYQFFHIHWWNTLSDPFFLRWIVTFTQTSLFPSPDQHSKQEEMLAFTEFAVHDMVHMMEDSKDNMATKSGYNSTGSLSLSYDPVVDKTALPKNITSSKMSHEPYQGVTAEETLELEPSLRFQEQPPTASKYEEEARAASAQRFTDELADRCTNDPSLDVTFLYDTSVKAITVDDASENNKPRISQLRTNRGVIPVPKHAKVVVAAGAWTPHVLALLDLYAPVYPLKGYALSLSAKDVLDNNSTTLQPPDLPSRIVSDKFMYTSRLGDEIRITSIGEFSGWSTEPTLSVDAEFKTEAVRQFPQLREFITKATTQCGHRPFVSDGILLLGKVDTHSNLFLSVGPGSNGWKLTMGSGEVIERLVSVQSEEQIAQDLKFHAGAFSPAGRVVRAPVFAKLCRARWNV